ncbi:phage tail protein [Maridesulfovibrio sp.]|uniref:phage tail protein n=1 Tax=Maridesulfovibrio sp. TaxID=2795000 RepID=UPI0029C9DA22|nr:phage tail protein [Maridesulfovibrio sp.]
MQLFQSFSEFMLEVSGVMPEQLECFVDRGGMILSGKDLGNCMELGHFNYVGSFWIESFKGDTDVLLGQIMAWLYDNDPYRFESDLKDPELDVTVVDRELINVDLEIAFEESIIVRRDPDGPISWNGEKWSVCPLDIDVAEDLESMDGKFDG